MKYRRLLGSCAQVMGLLVILVASATAQLPPASIELNTTGVPPLNTEEKTGFLDLIAAEAFSRIGIQLKTVHLPAERGLLDSNAGLEDGEMSRVNGLDRTYKNLIKVPEKIMDWQFTVFSKTASRIEGGWSGLKPYSTAFITGWKILEQNVPPDVVLTKVKNDTQLFMLLKNNRVDMVIYEKWGGMAQLRTQNIPDARPLNPPLAEREMYIYLHKKHADLVPRLTEALRAMKNDGVYQRIFKETLAVWEHN